MKRRQFLKSLGFGLLAPVTVAKAFQNPQALHSITWTPGEDAWDSPEPMYFRGTEIIPDDDPRRLIWSHVGDPDKFPANDTDIIVSDEYANLFKQPT